MFSYRWAAAALLWVATPVFAQGAAEPLTDPQLEAQANAAEPLAPAFEPTRLADLAIEVEPTRPDLIPTKHFAGRSAYRDFAVSPDGVHIAIEAIYDGDRMLVVMDAATQEALKVYRVDDNQRLDWFRWAGNQKLMMSISSIGLYYGFPVRVNRMFVRNLGTDEIWMLDMPSSVVWGGELIHVADDGSFALVSQQRSRRADPSVYRYELVPGAERERIVRPKGGVWSWHADDDGVVRLGLGWRGNRLRIYYRQREDDDFKLVDKLRANDDRARYWNVVRIVSGADRGYVLEENEEGRVGVRLFDYSTGETIETFYENPDWDVDELWLSRDGSPMAALFTDDRDQIEWFDPDMGEIYRQLGAALQLEELRIVSRSRNGETMLVWGGSEADPGALYVYSQKDRNLALLGNYRPELDFTQLARPVPVRYRARDGLEIPAYLTLPRGREPRNLPLIIMPHGGPFGVRDKLEYNDEVQLLANRGYAVLQPNFRGSGGYGEVFAEAGRGQVGRGMQDDVDDAMDWAVGEGIADAARVCVVGGSYGGFSALWAVIRNPERYVCAASWAGVTDWDRMLRYDRRYLGRESAREWRERQEGEDADLDDYSPVNLANTLSRPVLLAHGDRDGRVPVAQFERFVEASEDAPIRPVTLLLEGEGHSFSRAKNEQAWYDALDAFLAEHNPADQLDASGNWTPPTDPREAGRFTPLDIPSEPTNEAGEETNAEEEEPVA